MSRITLGAQRELIETLYVKFHDPKFLEWDPLSVVRSFASSRDQEYIALISALFAFGGVKQIIASVRRAIGLLELDPASGKIQNYPAVELGYRLEGFRHRIYTGQDLIALTRLYQRSVQVHGSLKEHFLVHHDPGAETIERGLTGLISEYKKWAEALEIKGPHFKHMLNSPEDGSTCKRWLMLLKWLIRRDDGIDLGLWSGSAALRPDQLLIPLDTHLFKISRKLRLTRMKTANWKAAREVTLNLKRIDPNDPTRFDFSLCRYGMFDYRNLHEKKLIP
ncbi:MAG: TIGR02757 family protein [Bdellovibrionales bacterium]|nr:TIGR02757 family protein [Bdellovibrionales bacterium]